MFDFPLFPESASTFAPKVDALYFFALAITAFFTLLIFAGVLWVVFGFEHHAATVFTRVDTQNSTHRHIDIVSDTTKASIKANARII